MKENLKRETEVAYTVDDIISALARLQHSEVRNIILGCYNPWELLKICTNEEEFDKAINSAKQYMTMYEYTIRGLTELREEVKNPTEIDTKELILNLYDTLNDDEKISVCADVRKQDDLWLAIDKFEDTMNRANPLAKAIFPFAAVAAGLMILGKE